VSDFKAKMNLIIFRLHGALPTPRWGAYSALPDPVAGFKEPTYKGRGKWKKEGVPLLFCIILWITEPWQCYRNGSMRDVDGLI